MWSVCMSVCDNSQTLFPIAFPYGEYVIHHCHKNGIDFRKNQPTDFLFNLYLNNS